ncbi:hypothetical protein B0H14DRAFT_2895909 [Mycena olivaceomarginata]|nr:hypothetical protein B0H14DRAFT_2895909 [Mycena olivaceomarginata]
MPHPSLALRHLSRLPVALRRRANAALEGNTVSEMPSLLARFSDSEVQHDPVILVSKLSHVILCLEGIALLDGNRRLPGPPCADIWQRAWPWIEFLGTHRDTLPHLPALSEVNPLSVVDALARDNRDTAALIRDTPGFRIFLFRAWVLSFDQARLTPILPATLPLTITDDHHFEEAIEGLRHIKCAVQSSVVSVGVVSMRSVVSLLQARCQVDASFRQISSMKECLCPHLFRVSPQLGPFGHAGINYFNVSWAVRYYLTTPFATQYTPPSASCRSSPRDPHSCRSFEPLSRSWEFPSTGTAFRGFPISEKWEAFWSILQSRLGPTGYASETRQISRKSACSNTANSLIAPRVSKFDWHHGGHRAMCDKNPGFGYLTFGCKPLIIQSFIRALLRRRLFKLKYSVLMKELTYMRSNPGAEFYVRFDYCTPYSPCEVSIEAVSNFELASDIWRCHTKRARESGGEEGVQALAAHTAVGDEYEQEQADSAEIKRLAELDILEVHI